MPSKFRQLVTLWLVVSVMGCTTIQRTSNPPAVYLKRVLHEGDRVGIETIDHKYYRLTVTKVDAKTITGLASGSVVAIPIDQIVESKIEQDRPLQEVAVIVGSLVVGTVLLIGLGYAQSKN